MKPENKELTLEIAGNLYLKVSYEETVFRFPPQILDGRQVVNEDVLTIVLTSVLLVGEKESVEILGTFTVPMKDELIDVILKEQ